MKPRFLLCEKTSLICASKPIPAILKNDCPFSFAESIRIVRPAPSVSIAFCVSIEIPKKRARPFPDPKGIIANAKDR